MVKNVEKKKYANFRVHLSGNTMKYSVGEGDGENERFQWIPLDEIEKYNWEFGDGKYYNANISRQINSNTHK